MNFDNILQEGVIYTPKLKKTKKELTTLLQPSMLFKIRDEIENNWRLHGLVSSNILFDKISIILIKFYDIHFIHDYKLESSAAFQYDEKSSIIYVNFNNMAKANLIYDSLKKTGKVSNIKAFVSHLINSIMHELIHYYQADSRIEKLDPDKMFYKEIKNNKKYKEEDWQYYYMNDKDEMMAFAIGIISDLKNKGYNQKEILDLISNDNDNDNAVLLNYRKFNKIANLPNWNTFLKYLYKYTTEYYTDM